MISIRKHLERLAGEDQLRKAFLDVLNSVIETTRDHILVSDSEEHAWFCSSLDELQRKLREDSSPTNIEVVSALLNKTLADHWAKISQHVQHRREELKRIINLLTEHAMRLDTENKQFYLELRTAVQTFQDISQIEDITYMRKKLSERVTQLQETVQYREVSSSGVVAELQQELEQAHQQIAVLSEGLTADSLTRLPSRQIAEKIIREQVEKGEGFVVAMVVIDRLDMMNLRYGVAVGDEVVRHFAKELRGKVPERIFLCRWGGPAFVGVEARALAPDVRAGLQKILAEIASQPMEVEAKGTGLIRITSRFAVHQWAPGQNSEKVIKLVDIFCVGEKTEAGEKQSVEAALS